MRIFGGRAVIVLAAFLAAVACSTPDKRPPESAGQPTDAAQVSAWSREDLDFFLHGSMSAEVVPERVLRAFARTDAGHFVFDTTTAGNSAAGHAYGSDMSAVQKQDLVEYLKRL